MDMQANRQLAVTQQQAWEALNDPVVLKACIPGCDKVEATGENQYAIGLALKIGPVAAKFAGKINLSDIKPPNSYNIAFEGQGGVAGFGKGNAQVTLTPNDAGCDLAYVVHASVGGKVAQLGQRLIDGAAKSMAEDFFKRFDDEMQRRFPEAYASKVIAGGQEVALAKGTKGSKIPVWVWIAGVVVVLALIWWLR
ncbi:SRPBCC family protein [Rhodoferax sediminis]|jgi:carbon monoxide dehydrogenase subunit G|uniref:Carbon monoxide dehydrogenase n=1 Tax=Rhodoferax sediminis TaxID=2509614 RepID=A0A515D9D0_9BURK|nr:carbon monoxide dehydrogenase subunit G [Rhodoferax sediminis]QDL37006.1 carbon monoxide dehydrogenase [Rhodoferax sediminis]